MADDENQQDLMAYAFGLGMCISDPRETYLRTEKRHYPTEDWFKMGVCPICFEKRVKISEMRCCHQFICSDCQEKWLQARGGSCPYCRFDTSVFIYQRLYQIFVKTLMEKTLAIEIHPHITIKEIKELIYQRLKIPVDKFRLFYSSKLLEDDRTAGDYCIWGGETLQTLLRCQGC